MSMISERLVVALRFLALLYVVAALAAHLLARLVSFQPPPASYAPGDGVLQIPTRDGSSIAAVYLANPTARYTILYSHGNAEDLGHVTPYLQELRQRGFAVISYDYRGYGASLGKATIKGTQEDIEAVYRYLTDSLGIPPQRIILHGYSLGGGFAVSLASRQPVAGIILESSFTSLFETVTRIPLFPFDPLPNQRRLRQIAAPVLVIHGDRDHVVPFSLGRRLAATAGGPRQHLWLAGAGHWDLRDKGGEDYWRAISQFSRLLAATRSDG